MSADQLFEADTHLVLPGGELLVARVTPEWQVEIGLNRRIDPKYGPEEAICLFALMQHLDNPMKIPELADRIVEIDKLASDSGAKPNPLTENVKNDDDFHNIVLQTFGKLVINPDCGFRNNAMFLGSGAERRLWLLGNVADIGYGQRKLEDFLIQTMN